MIAAATDNTNLKKARPFLKWVGGKNQLLATMSPHFPAHFKTFYEPFAGGGAVFFYLSPQTAVINDVNQKLIRTYTVIKNAAPELISVLKQIERSYHLLSEPERKEYFLLKRHEFNANEGTDLEVAALLIFLNKTCFNGMYRENSKGHFNVPFGKYTNPKICDDSNILQCAEALRNTDLSSVDYKTAIARAQAGDFIYFDPPYDPVSETASFTSYSSSAFNKKEQIELRDMFVELDKRGCLIMLSNSATDFIKEIYAGYTTQIVKARRSINASGLKRGAVDEIIITNYGATQHE